MDRKNSKMLGILIVLPLVCVGGWICFLVGTRPNHMFNSAVQKILESPHSMQGNQTEISTSSSDEWSFFNRMKSKDINELVVEAYKVLSAHLKVNSVTFFSQPGSMPTEETIWQYPDFFVRLYAASSLDCDGAAIGVFTGNYSDFRKGKISYEPGDGFDGLYRPEKFIKPINFFEHGD
jgi:hypothetical protein